MKQQLLADRAAGWAFYLHSTAGVPDALVGVCHKTGEIGRLYVDPAAQGQGNRRQAAGVRAQKAGRTSAGRTCTRWIPTGAPLRCICAWATARPGSGACTTRPWTPNATVLCREIKFVYGTKNSG